MDRFQLVNGRLLEQQDWERRSWFHRIFIRTNKSSRQLRSVSCFTAVQLFVFLTAARSSPKVPKSELWVNDKQRNTPLALQGQSVVQAHSKEISLLYRSMYLRQQTCSSKPSRGFGHKEQSEGFCQQRSRCRILLNAPNSTHYCSVRADYVSSTYWLENGCYWSSNGIDKEWFYQLLSSTRLELFTLK